MHDSSGWGMAGRDVSSDESLHVIDSVLKGAFDGVNAPMQSAQHCYCCRWAMQQFRHKTAKKSFQDVSVLCLECC